MPGASFEVALELWGTRCDELLRIPPVRAAFRRGAEPVF
jgi:hypothetical protein